MPANVRSIVLVVSSLAFNVLKPDKCVLEDDLDDEDLLLVVKEVSLCDVPDWCTVELILGFCHNFGVPDSKFNENVQRLDHFLKRFIAERRDASAKHDTGPDEQDRESEQTSVTLLYPGSKVFWNVTGPNSAQVGHLHSLDSKYPGSCRACPMQHTCKENISLADIPADSEGFDALVATNRQELHDLLMRLKNEAQQRIAWGKSLTTTKEAHQNVHIVTAACRRLRRQSGAPGERTSHVRQGTGRKSL